MRRAAWLAISATIWVTDQVTKRLIVAALPQGSVREVIPGFFRLVHNRNRGIAFGLFGDGGEVARWVLIAVVVAIAAVVLWQLLRSAHPPLVSVALALILGGALGNLTDRVLHTGVADFLEVYVRLGGAEHAWPAFNVADSAITTGAVLLLFSELFTRRRDAPNAD